MVVFLVMAVPAFLGIRVALDRPCDDGHQDAFLRRTKVGASAKYEDSYGRSWEIDEVSSGAWVAICDSYSPKGKVFGSSFDDVKVKIEKWAFTNRPGTLFTELGGVRVDGNGAIWARTDRWAPALSKYPPEIPSGIRYVATSDSYLPIASVESMTELDLVARIDAYAETHKTVIDTILTPKPKPSGPGPSPAPKPSPSPSPSPAPFPTPSPAPGPGAPVAKAEGGTLLYAGMGIGVAALIGWGLLS